MKVVSFKGPLSSPDKHRDSTRIPLKGQVEVPLTVKQALL